MKVPAVCILVIFFVSGIQAQTKRFDSSMKFGKAGYRVICSNKSTEKNAMTIYPIGFESAAHEIGFDVKGRIMGAEVDDLNNDGFPDLVIYLVNGGKKNTAMVIGISSDNNQGYNPIVFPDILDDQKLSKGYYGFDQYNLMEGTLMRRFPLYDLTDTAHIKPTGVMRQVQYRVVPGENGALKFKVVRSYEFNKPQ